MTDVADVSWFILLTFPNGGSTPITKLLLTARNTVALTRSEIVNLLSSSIPQLALADPNAAVVVKDYPAQTIRDMNKDKLSQLTSGQTAAIARRLARDADLVNRLGYQVDVA